MIAIFVNGAYNNYTRGYNFPIQTTLKKFLWLEFRSGLSLGPIRAENWLWCKNS